MPHYKSRSKNKATRERKRVQAQVPKDKRKLGHWAVRGTDEDYRKLREKVFQLEPERPSYVTERAMKLLKRANRLELARAAHERDNHWFTDGLAWLIDKAPSNSRFKWFKSLGQAALKPFRGDSLNETDEQYSRLTNHAYSDAADRPEDFEHWTRQSDFDSDWLTVFDNDDGHRFVGVRGTKANIGDIAQDALVGLTGHPVNTIGKELKRVLDHTEPGRMVDIGAHSLGTSLVLQAFDDDDTLQDRVHQTYLYNPAVSPFTTNNITQKFEDDSRVRYFVDLLDPVSVGQLGSKGPRNVVYRTSYKDNPLDSHKLVQWGGDGTRQSHDEDKQDETYFNPKRREFGNAELVNVDNIFQENAVAPVGPDPGVVFDFGDAFPGLTDFND